MMNLPEDFIRETRLVMGETRLSRLTEALHEEPPVSIRLNPRKTLTRGLPLISGQSPPTRSLCEVPWCQEGFYLNGRPQFTFDPLFHAGCYYVQEASSMFISHVLRQLVKEPVAMLDLCAAPGGKSTAAISSLPEGSSLTSNEPVHARFTTLEENITKWGYPGCSVTNKYPRDFRKARAQYDVILCDVPCSGEGMFRKDSNAVGEWSLQNVERCWRLQREIVADAWQCLVPGGILIYSTCTFNLKENEENVRWIRQEYDAEMLSVPTQPEWGITGSLLEGFDAPVYRFIPGFTKGEGLFMAVMRKPGEHKKLRPFCAPSETGGGNPHADLSYQEALRYLRGEALTLSADTPRGIVTVTYKGIPLGTAKNIGSRANNLYPKAWRIKTTHLPSEAPEVLQIVKS